MLLSKTRGSLMSSCVLTEFNIKRIPSLGIALSLDLSRLGSFQYSLCHTHCLYLCNLIVRFIMHTVLSMLGVIILDI